MNRLTQTRHGPMYYAEHDACIGKSLEMYGDWGKDEIDRLTPLVKAGDIVLDIGANIGTHTIPLAQIIGPTGCVLSFEPQRRLYQILCANVVANHLANVVTSNYAISDKIGVALAPNLDFDVPNNFGAAPVKPEGAEGANGQPVNMSTVDALGMPRCALIKADIEGGELAMVLGAQQTIKHCRPFLYLESHAGHDELVALCKSLGYRVYVHNAPSYSAANWKQNTEDIHNGYLERNILCAPIEREAFECNLEEA